MNLKQIIASTAVALTLVTLPALADDVKMNNNANNDRMEQARSPYDFEVVAGDQMMFREPVSFTGEVTETTGYDRTVKAQNGMTIRIPNQALVWNGDRNMFAQTTEVGDTIVVHMRQDEPYRIMMTPDSLSPWIAVGSYDGVFYLSKEFVEDIDIENLDNNIYSDRDGKIYDEDLETNNNN